jgi:hypothetical protein
VVEVIRITPDPFSIMTEAKHLDRSKSFEGGKWIELANDSCRDLDLAEWQSVLPMSCSSVPDDRRFGLALQDRGSVSAGPTATAESGAW